jgi:hypothetical protein
MPPITYLNLLEIPPGLSETDLAVLKLWWDNNPIDLKPSRLNVKIPLPKPPGPVFPFPFARMQFPLIEWIIPILHEGTFRRVAIHIKGEPTDDNLKYVAYSTIALLYQFPDYRITSAMLICIRATDDQLKAAVAFGIGLTIVPAVFAKK